MTSHERSSADTNWRAALEEYRAAKDRAAGAFRPDAKTCADLLARVAGVVRKGRSSPAGHDDATQRAAAAREIVDAPRGTWFLGADAAARQTSGGRREGAATSDVRAGGRPGAVGRRDDGGDVRAPRARVRRSRGRGRRDRRARARTGGARRCPAPRVRARAGAALRPGRAGPGACARARRGGGGRRPGRGGPCGAPRLRGRRGAARPRAGPARRVRARRARRARARARVGRRAGVRAARVARRPVRARRRRERRVRRVRRDAPLRGNRRGRAPSARGARREPRAPGLRRRALGGLRAVAARCVENYRGDLRDNVASMA